MPRVIRKRVICFQGVASRLSCMRWSPMVDWIRVAV
jgi:hypothetical protein